MGDWVDELEDAGRIAAKYIGDARVVRMSPEDALALVAEVRAGRQFHEDIVSALAPGRWRGYDGPDGVNTHEVIDDVAAALSRHDQAVGVVAPDWSGSGGP